MRPLVLDLGFLVVKNVLDKKLIKSARDAYFNLFEQGEYKEFDNDWIHLKNHEGLMAVKIILLFLFKE